MSMSQKRIYEFLKNPKNIKVSRTSVNDSTTTNSVSSSTNVGPAVHSANVIPSAAKPASAVTAPAEDGAANTAVYLLVFLVVICYILCVIIIILKTAEGFAECGPFL